MLSFRSARESDVPQLVAMLADDKLGSQREDVSDPLPDSYMDAFASIDADPNNEFVVATIEKEIVGFLQLTFIPYLTHTGSWRALVEGVRVSSRHRGEGLGSALIEHAVELARERHCRIVQLTTDKQRPQALAFYESLGFVASHEGLKLQL